MARGPFVDRIEGKTAVLVAADGKQQNVPLASLPKGVREGVYLTADLKSIDEATTKELKAEIAALRKTLKKDDDGGSFSL